MNCDDPNLTAYALGELSEEEKLRLEKVLEASPQSQHLVAETRELAALLRGEFAAELSKCGRQSNIVHRRRSASLWWDSQWMSIRIAALVAIAAVIATLVICGLTLKRKYSKPTLAHSQASSGEQDMAMELPKENAVEGQALEATADLNERERLSSGSNPGFMSAAAFPEATFGLSVDTSAYGRIRELIYAGKRPPEATVRIEGMINYFEYAYPAPAGVRPFSISTEATICPWNSDHRLVRIGLKGRDADNSIVAENVKVEVRFNASSIESYRLLGYDDLAGGQASKAASGGAKMRSHQSVTALYEVIPVPNAPAPSGAGVASVTAIYKSPGKEQTNVEESKLPSLGGKLEDASGDLRFATAVAEFGMILRGDIAAGEIGAVIEEAECARTIDAARAEFVQVAKEARRLWF